MIKEKNLKWVYSLAIAFILVNAVCTYFEFYYFNLVPAAILVLLLAVYSLDKLIMLVVFLTPFAINLQDLEGGLGISLPTEPIMFGIMMIFLLKQLHHASFDSNVIRHPVTIAVVMNLTWIFITSVTSDLPVVSFKFLIARLWFVIVFYFLGTRLFKNYKNIKTFIWLYLIPFAVIIIYTLICHAQVNFDEQIANYIMSPFYNDHTVYGAMLAMFFPVLFFFTLNKKYSASIRFAAVLLLVVYIIGLIFSYTRAAWVSLAVAFVAFILLQMKVKFKFLLMAFAVLASVAFIYQTDIVMKLEKNRQDASQDFDKHIESISNISTDASNLERLNRWNAAFRMFHERPFFGWGPGTYSFEYAPFQHAKEKTIISTNMGDKGNAHSEYIGPLCESGFLGLLTFVTIIICVCSAGFRLYYTLKDYETKRLVLCILLGFITYITHGALNNFLDTDKASVPFWGFVAMIVAIDIYHSNREKLTVEEPGKV
ncbi:MAG TPA: O-antigen ligase family protein [Bacteroidia bacterium]